MKTYRPILFVLLFAVVGVVLFLFTSWKDSQRVKQTQNWINHTNEVIRQLDIIYNTILSEESSVRGYTISGNDIFIWDIPNNNKKVLATLQHTHGLLKDNSQQAARLKKVQSLVEQKLGHHTNLIQIKTTNPDSANALVSSLTGKKITDQLNAAITEMKMVEHKLLQDRIGHSKEVAESSFNRSLIGSLIITIFIWGICLKLIRDIKLRKKTENQLIESETRYRQFVENAGVINYTADQSGHFTFISSQVEALTGFTPEELLGKHFTTLIPQDWVPIVSEKYYNQFTNHIRETTLVFPIIHKSSEMKWVEQDAILLEKNNIIQGFQCVVKDVTERTRVEQKLRKAEEEKNEVQFRIQAILDNTPLIIYIKDLKGRYTLVNKQFKEVFRLTDEDVIGKTVQELHNDIPRQTQDTVTKYQDADLEVIKTGASVELEDVLKLPDGDHHLLTVKFPLFDKYNEIFGVSGFMKDISEMVRYRQDLIEARTKAESAELLQEQFLANMSHEIRTPMNGIIGMSNLLIQTPLQRHQKEYLEIIRQSSENLMVLINDILDLSKIKAGKISLEQIAFDLDSIIQPLIATFEIKAAEKSIGFSVSLYPDVPRFLTGDPYRLNQVLNNLLSNAFKFTEKGFVTMEVDLEKMENETAWVSLRISDSGIGIKHEQLNYIFESFSQASSDTTRKYGGTGLGLAITKKLVEIQGGTIYVTSQPNAGTTFSITIPYQIANEDQVQHTLQQTDAIIDPSHAFSGKKVLIVEDNEVNQRVLQLNLQKFNIDVSIAGDGSAAVEWLSKNRDTDMVFMDLHMPVMDGLQATICIRKDLKLTTPVVMLTAAAQKSEQQRCLDAGADAYITKPISQQELYNSLERYLLINQSPEEYIPYEADMSNYSEFNISELLQLGDAESIRMVYELFEATLPPGLENLKQAAIKKDWKTVYEQAHKLKSSLAVIQVKGMLGIMGTIEHNAKQQMNLASVLPMIEEASAYIIEVMPRIKTAIEKETA
ncbi:PAS domain S-box protein [Pseudobacter ginsenosidimutans]|uniref:Sensory/regulatory protein RpfC n=1 Tax=Pseudobacter ginsenosidimutans TaxID=661488 RepID=A0A4V2F0X5_9BACT|nr:PAS domain S-box protein [Pseudobacter ginsenosidimutans]QEC41564.1 PAS domain S-box protein [Pseudobacter ginsenosidimutans]RZS71651.1 PAS domain S-box-containing protein [Pseudobacter ginsenosidimutans]